MNDSAESSALASLQAADRELEAYRERPLPPRPASGWANHLRQLLGKPARLVGDRLGLQVRSVFRLEQAEATEVITLANLRRLADALDCDLAYVMVPRQPLEEQLRSRAREVAKRRLERLPDVVWLENPEVAQQGEFAQLDWLTEKVLRDGSRRLW